MSAKLSVYERAQKYVSKMDAAISGDLPGGGGGHAATFAVAKALVDGFALSKEDALAIMREYNGRCSPPWKEHELLHKVNSISSSSGYLLKESDSYTPRHAPGSLPEVRPAEPAPAFDAAKLARFAAPWADKVNAAWLADRSDLDPTCCTTHEFLSALYYPERGEKVLVFLNEFSQGDALWPDAKELPSEGPRGVWYLAQPVDGVARVNPRGKDPSKLSRRIAECVVAWRYLVLESDQADACDWMGAVVQLPLRIAAIYTSGGRSIHVLVRVDAVNASDWDRVKAAILKGLVTLGADRGALSGVRLTRLPNCLRLGEDVVHEQQDSEKKPMKEYKRFPRPQLQKLLYVCREPAPRPICEMIPRRDIVATLEGMVRTRGLALMDLPAHEMHAVHRRLSHVAAQSPVCKSAAREIGELMGGGAK